MINVLITGGLGYVGGRISKYLSENTDLNLIITSHKKNAEKPAWLKNGQIVYMNLLEDSSIFEVCKNINIIIHLAALNEIDSANNMQEALKINSLGTLKLLEESLKANVEKFIYLSTAHIYGAPLSGRIKENNLPRPVHPYSITHKTAEDFVLSFNDTKKIKGIVLRLSNSFGYPMSPDVNRWTLLVNDLAKQAVTTKKLILKSSGIQKRDFITLTDVCRAVEHIINLDEKEYGNNIFNLGGDYSTSIYDLTKRIAERTLTLFGYYPEIIVPKKNENEKKMDLNYSIKKLRSTGFNLLKNIDFEIDSTLEFCKKHFCN